MSNDLQDIGQRLRAFRLGRGISPEDLALRIGISRAALYRAEKGHITKIETLSRIADVLGVSLPSLLGVGVEYIDSALAFFERMRQIEEASHQIVVLFGPISYLLTSPAYDTVLREVLIEALPGSGARDQQIAEVDRLMAILAQRKAQHAARSPSVVSLISAAELDRFLHNGLIGRLDLPADTVAQRRRMALDEARRILDLLNRQPIGVQIGIIRETVPNTSFQIFRQTDRSVLGISPFRLGEQPNVQVGVAMITSAPEAMALHERIASDLWQRSLKGRDAADFLAERIAFHERTLPDRAASAVGGMS